MMRKICLYLGATLILISVLVLATWSISVNTAKKRMAERVDEIYSLIPEVQGAVPEERRDNTMATLSLDKKDYVGVIEMPKFSSALPVSTSWGRLTSSPSRYSGSAYDASLKIGATTQKGQYDFYKEISVGDSVFFTDMEGNRFSYSISDIRYENHIGSTELDKVDSSLTIFIKNIYGFEYMVIYCK